MKKYNKYKYIVIIVLLLALCLTYGISFAKYAYNNVLNYYYKSKEFYFSSNNLDINEITNTNNNWNGDSVKIDLKNYLNDSLITEYDISYEVKCSTNNSNYDCTINGTNSNKYNGILSSSKICINNKDDNVDTGSYSLDECIDNGYEWSNLKSEKEISINLVSKNNESINDVVVYVTATSTSPYNKTIKGQFKLTKPSNKYEDIGITYKDYDDYGELIISNLHDKDNNYLIGFDSSKLRVDMDNAIKKENIDTDNNINEVSTSISKKSNIKIIFYKIDKTKNYNKEDFNISILSES